MSTTSTKSGEIFKFTQNWNPQLNKLKETFAKRRNGHSWLKSSAWLILFFLATTMWQCNKDDYTGETVGVCPKVISTDPDSGATNVALGKIITATFNEVMDSSTINESTFLLKQGTDLIAGKVTFVDSTATFTPTSPLAANTVYTGIITTGAIDLAGNSPVKNYVWKFSTGNAPIINYEYDVVLSASPTIGGSTLGGGTFAEGALVNAKAVPKTDYTFVNWTEGENIVSVNANYSFIIDRNRTLKANFTGTSLNADSITLGSAGNFAVLSGSGVTNIGVNTMITGNVGSYPTATMNGILSGNVNGVFYINADPIVGVAKTDLTAAYNEAQGRSLNAISLPGQLGGLTLVPGLYVNSISSGISGTGTNGILTLDAGGDANAVWVFKMGSTLVTDAGTSIVLAGGAQSKNIYWSVGSSATLGTNSIFYGTILADQSITLTTGAKLYGRALTRIGAVTLESNIIVKPN